MADMSDSLLELHDVETSYGLSRVLFGVSLTVGRGEMVSLLGRNGMGKTTTVRSIMGLTPAAAGSIRFGGEEIRLLPPTGSPSVVSAWFRKAGRCFQISPPARTSSQPRQITELPPSRGRSKKVMALFPRLAERASSMANLLSGGEQQMLAIGRALMTNPRLLILDEATEGLAPRVRDEIWRSLERLRAGGQSILVIDKNVKALTGIADRHYIIERGRVVWVGSSQQLAQAPAIQHRYLGI